jgi:hypothetical protein
VSAAVRVREVQDSDRPALRRLVPELWAASIVVARGTVREPATLPGLVAERGGRIAARRGCRSSW